MILANAVGPGTYGPFNVRPGSYLVMSTSVGTGNITLHFTDELGNTAQVGGLTGGATNATFNGSLPAGQITLDIPGGISSASVTLNPTS